MKSRSRDKATISNGLAGGGRILAELVSGSRSNRERFNVGTGSALTTNRHSDAHIRGLRLKSATYSAEQSLNGDASLKHTEPTPICTVDTFTRPGFHCQKIVQFVSLLNLFYGPGRSEHMASQTGRPLARSNQNSFGLGWNVPLHALVGWRTRTYASWLVSY